MSGLSRRRFLGIAAGCGLATAGGSLLWSDRLRLPAPGPGPAAAGDFLDELLQRAPVARHWISTETAGTSCAACHDAGEVEPSASHRHETPVVQCRLCAHQCVLRANERGRCRARLNVDGQLRSLVYGRPISEHVDPIEKKPFYHFLPGSRAYSLATAGCPLRCRFCQNWQISQADPEDYAVPFCAADEMADRAGAAAAPVVAFTYNEPTVFFEYLVDVAAAARQRGIRPVLISCGYMNEAPLAEMLAVLDAVKIDLKGYSPAFYREVSSAELEPVLRSIRQVARSGRHLELVNLVVPTLNDDPTSLTELCRWVSGELGPDVPVHFTRFHPDYQLAQLPPTPVASLERARDLAREHGIHYAYVGNVPGHPGNHTYCPRCGEVCVERQGFLVVRLALDDGCCRRCGTRLAGVWS
jgi:pyruvate formate lyase activating enzyme